MHHFREKKKIKGTNDKKKLYIKIKILEGVNNKKIKILCIKINFLKFLGGKK